MDSKFQDTELKPAYKPSVSYYVYIFLRLEGSYNGLLSKKCISKVCTLFKENHQDLDMLWQAVWADSKTMAVETRVVTNNNGTVVATVLRDIQGIIKLNHNPLDEYALQVSHAMGESL